jgi:hypothetical protein
LGKNGITQTNSNGMLPDQKENKAEESTYLSTKIGLASWQ